MNTLYINRLCVVLCDIALSNLNNLLLENLSDVVMIDVADANIHPGNQGVYRLLAGNRMAATKSTYWTDAVFCICRNVDFVASSLGNQELT